MTQDEQIIILAVGIFFITAGLISLSRKIFRVKNEKIPLYTGITTGVLLLVVGLSVLNSSPFSLAIMVPGFILFLKHFIVLLVKRFPNQKDRSFILTPKK